VSLKTGSGRITVQTNRPFPQTQIKFLERNHRHEQPKRNGSLFSGNLEGEGEGANLRIETIFAFLHLPRGSGEHSVRFVTAQRRNGVMAQWRTDAMA